MITKPQPTTEQEWEKELDWLIGTAPLGYDVDLGAVKELVMFQRQQAATEATRKKVDDIKWWLFDTGKFTNDELLEFKSKFEIRDKIRSGGGQV